MGTTERVAFRYYENQPPQWEAYGIDSAATVLGTHWPRRERTSKALPPCSTK